MTIQTVFMLILIGLAAGTLSGFVGVGGGVIMVPAMMYVLGMSQHMAQGTSLFLMLFPIGILAVMNYYKAGEINWTYGIIIACAFVFGGYFGSKLALKISPHLVKLIFGFLMLYVAGRMIYKGYRGHFSENQTSITLEE